MSSPACPLPENEPRTLQFAASLREQCNHVRQSLVMQQTRWEEDEATLRQQLQELMHKLETQRTEEGHRLRQLEEQLAAQAQIATAEKGSSSTAASEDFHRRYDMALEDLRELKAKNAELQQQVAQLRSSGIAATNRTTGGVLDWEAEKARILAMLEGECDASPERQAERIEIQKVIHTTEQVIAAKDHRIEELQRQLTEQSQNTSLATEGNMQAILDKDALIAEERAKLQRIQQEWKDKLRQSEIELSLERARLARLQAGMETKKSEAATESSGSSQAASAAEKPARGRWLARLGLVDSESHQPPAKQQ